MKKIASLSLVLVLLIGCASSSVTKTSSESLTASPSNSEIIVFSKESEIQNLIDEVQSLNNSTIYKLKNLF